MKDKTKELADSVGAVYPVLFMGRHDGVLFTETELETFVDLVAAHEREAIAKLADASVNADQYPTLTMLAQAIRMRGD
jgi:hypothetical protein